MRRAAVLWVVLFGVYASTVGLHATGRSDYAGDEPHYLLTAKSLIEDGDADLLNQYRDGAYRSFYPYVLEPHGALTSGHLDEPHGLGFPALIAPAYAAGGAKAVEFMLAAIAALAVALAYRLALRVVPDPWALGAALALGLSPPMVAYSTAVYPELTVAALLAGAALMVARLGDGRPSRRAGLGLFTLLALVPWLGLRFAPAAIVVAAYGQRSLRRARRWLVALFGLEIVAFSIAVYVGVNGRLYGGPSPYSAAAPGDEGTGAAFPLGYLHRAYRLVALFVDRDYGLLRWAPVLVLAFVGAWLLLRERRVGLARAIPGLAAEQSAATMCALAAGAQLVVAAFLAPTMFGTWFPARHLVAVLPLAAPLVGLGLRRFPRSGVLLAAIGVGASVWLYVAVRAGDATLVGDRPRAPFGPLTSLWPLFTKGSVLPFVVAACIGIAMTGAVLAALYPRAWRRPAG
ncbi:MAG: hypothetical protein QOD53_1892 [Thermoleophilaceae bacterium]|jgi:hypothetical protein|nr:hypothetical protein [Thermoleophilaceae bacterium]